jgi:hypothetical protein
VARRGSSAGSIVAVVTAVIGITLRRKCVERLVGQERVAALFKESLTVLSLTIESQVSLVIHRVRLKNFSLPALGSALARDNKAGYGRNSGKGKKSDGKDAKHCKREGGDVGENGV